MSDYDKYCKIMKTGKRYTTEHGKYVYIGKTDDDAFAFYLIKGWYDDIEYKGTLPAFNKDGDLIYRNYVIMRRTKSNPEIIKVTDVHQQCVQISWIPFVPKASRIEANKSVVIAQNKQAELILKIVKGDSINLCPEGNKEPSAPSIKNEHKEV